MSDITIFESRVGKLAFRPEKIYSFVTDLRNFERFIPKDTVSGHTIGPDSGTFQAGMLGTVTISISGKTPFGKVVYSGNLFGNTEYSMVLDITEKDKDSCEVRVSITAALNPIMKMMAAAPAAKFLDILIDEMEKFRE
jgi:hypothetical protein